MQICKYAKNILGFGYEKSGALDSALSVIPLRFERRTHSLEGCCSIQLSYGTIKIGCKGSGSFWNIQISSFVFYL